jgi:Cellulose synthase subunit D
MNNLDDYFRSQQVAIQWSPILRSVALELSTQAEVEALHQLFIKVGLRFAENVEPRFQAVKTVSELTDALNDLWSQTNWGWVALREARDHLEIEHRYAPLTEAFGEDMLAWTVGILEGFYQGIFQSFGPGGKMAAKFVAQKDNGLSVQIHLAPQ